MKLLSHLTILTSQQMLLLQGRHDDVPVTYAVNNDPFTELGRHPTELHKLSEHLMSFFDIVRYRLRNVH